MIAALQPLCMKAQDTSSAKRNWKPAATLFVLSAVLVYGFVAKITVGLWFSDFYGHTKTLHEVLIHQTGWPAHIGFYAITALMSGFSTDLTHIHVAGAVVVSAAVVAKLVITFVQGQRLSEGSINPWQWVFACLVLNFGLSIPNIWLHWFSRQYLVGNVTFNVWHNSTTMLVMPFAMMQFVSAYRWLVSGVRRDLVMMVVWGVLAVCVKPSYLMAFLPSFGVMTVWRWHLSRPTLDAIIACSALFAILLLQKSLLQSAGNLVGVEFGWLRTWRTYHQGARWPDLSIALSFLLSLWLPMAVLWWRPTLRKDWLVRFGFVQFGFAVMISMVLSESGTRMFHGNFVWQVVICCFLLYWGLAIRALQMVPVSTLLVKRWHLVAGLAMLHLICGLGYLVRAIVVYTFV